MPPRPPPGDEPGKGPGEPGDPSQPPPPPRPNHDGEEAFASDEPHHPPPPPPPPYHGPDEQPDSPFPPPPPPPPPPRPSLLLSALSPSRHPDASTGLPLYHHPYRKHRACLDTRLISVSLTFLFNSIHTYPTLSTPPYDPHNKPMAAPTQVLPSWLSLSTTVITFPDGSVTTSSTTLQLPLTYYGPSVSIFFVAYSL